MTTCARDRVSTLAALVVCLVASCGSITLTPDAGTGTTTGAAGHGQAGAGGSTGSAGSTGAAGSTTGAAGTKGGGGTTGAAGSTTGAAGSIGTAGSIGAAGSTGAAGTKGTGGAAGGGAAGSTGAGGHGGAGGTGVMCGPVCDIFCQYGNVLDANGCPTCACNPAPASCSQAECGTAPSFRPIPCTGPPAAPTTCVRGSDGKCSWRAPFCPMCGTSSCPNLSCTSGFVPDTNGCPTCTCNTCPQGTHPMACPQVSCNIACADGFVHDANGCATCACRTAASCAPPGVSCVACPFGYRTGPNGCRTCACEDPPAGCLANGLAVP